jgi:hypothetical protein
MEDLGGSERHRAAPLPPIRRNLAMKTVNDAAYTMAALSAAVALFRALIKKGVLARDEAVRAILDEAVARAIQAESQQPADKARTTNEVNRQSAEILKFIAEKL